ncbi:uncharacterized protein LOC134284305 [Aedes albopictus]|uniref:CCHC-type domain-containing protein n=1 Tax=Aedes albopictus TaxID=7160 RepID=A0ABM1Z0C7_AEDAL
MNQLFPRAEDLTLEEIDYELVIRQQPEEVFRLELSSKQRHLRHMFKEDQKEGRNYRSPYSISEEAPHIEGRIENLAKALEKRVETKFESRVIHYWYRVKRAVTRNDEEKMMRRDLIRKIEKIMQDFQFGPSLCPYKTQINKIIQDCENGASGQTGNPEVQRIRSPTVSDQIEDSPQSQPTPKGAVRKNTNLEQQEREEDRKSEFVVSRQEWEDMKSMMMNLMNKISGNDQEGRSRGTDSQRSHTSERRSRQIPSATLPQYNPQRRPMGSRSESRDSSEDDRQIHQLPRDRFDPSDEEDVYRRQPAREFRVQPQYDVRRSRERVVNNNRIEKWKLRCTGEPRSMPIENFLYKAKKLADREGVSMEILLRDIHMLLEGAASDWFFTFVDELDTWDVFETNIVYRFGNPNKDQGIRTKIHERKQQRGESFIAFVTEIEKLNKMLSRPLSARRKFEIVWDNMRQHYRSKISIVEVNDLQHLTRLNYRIDAADPQLQYQTGEMPGRRPINQIEAEDTDYDSDRSATVNEIRRRFNRDGRQRPNDNREERNRQQNDAGQQAGNGNQAVPPMACWNCQTQGHGWRQCNRPKVVFCYGCGSLGRTTRTCERCSRNYGVPATEQQGNE